MHIIPKITKDGTYTLYVPEIDEHYHSVNGAREESDHIFIKAGIQHHAENNLSIFEVGFGTGLNALLAYLEATDNNKKIDYTSIELFPLEKEIVSQLNYAHTEAEKHIFDLLHQAEWNKKTSLTDCFSIHKIKADITSFNFEHINPDVVFFDAFAPEKQPEMWNNAIFANIYNAMNPNGILTTYCAKGAVRRMMQDIGFRVERIPGPPGKREMLRAKKIQ